MKSLSQWAVWLSLALLLGAGPKKSLILATTTSTQDSGLLDLLVPLFEARTGYAMKTIAVGSGQALALGRRGEADVLLVHSPEAEEKFMAEGYGSRRRAVMHNDFVLLGPAGDPAGVKKATSAAAAFQKLAAAEALFFSRGDDSGTHSLEKKLWQASRTDPVGKKWHQETGLGMGATLNIAAEKKGYTLSDRGTFLALKKGLSLEVVREGDPSLLNLYHVIEVDASKRPKVAAEGAAAFADFMVSAALQNRIKGFGVAKFGAPLFYPDAR